MIQRILQASNLVLKLRHNDVTDELYIVDGYIHIIFNS